MSARGETMGGIQKGLLRRELHLGHIEVAAANRQTLVITCAGSTFFQWINHPPNSEVSLPQLLTSVSAEQFKEALKDPGCSCECEEQFVGSDGVFRALRFRLCVQEKATDDSIRLFVADISEIKRKDAVMRSVTTLLDINRTSLQDSQRKLKTLLDSIPQVVLSVNAELRIASESSAPIERMFGANTTGKSIAEILPFSSAHSEALQLAFSGVDWDLIVDALPRELQYGDRILTCAFFSTYEANSLTRVTVIIEDQTDKRRMQDAWERTNADNRALIGVASSREEFLDLFYMAREAVNHVNSYSEITMFTHTLKGGFAGLECHEFSSLCHAAEDSWRESHYTPDQGRDFLECLNRSLRRFLSVHGEVLQLSIDDDVKDARRSIKVEKIALQRLYNAATECRIDGAVLSMIEGLTEKPFSEVLNWLENVWQKTLRAEGKEGSPITWSGNVRVAREPYRQLFQSFVHIIRNTVDHGIEMPDERLQSGKSERGNFSITARRDGDLYYLAFKDDGRGIDPQRVLEVAAKRGISIPAGISREETFMLLATPGLSSKDTVTELSGRGIGLDVVRYEAQQLGGDLSIKSELGEGTEITVWFKYRSGLL
jgi:two-component system chemotaxis sensor kinase CheA